MFDKEIKKKGLSAEDLKRLPGGPMALDSDAMSEFSVLTMESDMTPQENILDLKISNLELNETAVNKFMGMRDSLPQAIQTFMMLEFYDHPTKNTDLVREYHPDINTIFSFKNKVDDFYLKNLKESSISVELYIVKAGEGE
jgi:hypothetical protein